MTARRGDPIGCVVLVAGALGGLAFVVAHACSATWSICSGAWEALAR
jgi:hypothetical protein